MSHQEKTSKLGLNTLLYLMALAIPKIVAVVTLPIYSNWLDPTEYGIFTYTTNFSAFLAVVSALGFNSYYLVSYGSTNDKKLLNGTMFWSLNLWNFAMLSILGVATWFLWPVMNMSFSYYPYVPIALVTHFFFVMDIIPMRTYRLRGEVHYYFTRTLVKSILSAGLGILFVAVFKMGVMGRYWAEFIHNFIFAVVFILYMLKHSVLKIDKKILLSALKFGCPLVPSGIVTQGQGAINSLITEKLLSLTQLGIYSMGASIASMINMVTQSISLAVEPEYYLRFGKPEYNDFVRKIKNVQIAIVSWICVGCSLFIREALILFVNESYWDCWPVVQVLALSYVIMVLTGVYNSQVLLYQKTKTLLVTNVLSLALMILVELIVLPWIGIIGIGIASVFCNLFCFIVYYFVLGRKTLKNMQLGKDFCIIGIIIVFILITNCLGYLSIYVDIAVKILCFILFTAGIMAAYKIRTSDLLMFFKKKKEKKND